MNEENTQKIGIIMRRDNSYVENKFIPFFVMILNNENDLNSFIEYCEKLKIYEKEYKKVHKCCYTLSYDWIILIPSDNLYLLRKTHELKANINTLKESRINDL